MNKLYTLLFTLFLLPSLTKAQIRKVDLVGYQACGGATLIPSLSFTGGYTGVTLYYEKLVAADTWQLEATQTYNSITGSWQIYNGDDLLAQTTFRVRALDEITGAIYTSNSVTVGPNTWNLDRGTSFFSVYGHWGATCDTNSNYITVEMNYTTAGRPPYTIDYKKSDETNWHSIGQYVKGAFITGIVPGTSYNVRITDVCGKVTSSGASISMQASYNIDQNATSCTNGQVTLNLSTDDRYSGVQPLTYALTKYQPSQNTQPAPVYKTNNVFTNLSPGVYYYSAKDACGNLSSTTQTFALGSGLMQANATSFIGSDSCQRIFSITTYNGARPLRYGIKAPSNNTFVYGADSAITVSQDGWYTYQVISACGDTTATYTYFVSIAYPNAAATDLSAANACTKTIQVQAAGSYGPYTYAVRLQGSSTPFVYQTSDIVSGLAPGIYELSVQDRCGRTNWVAASIDVSQGGCHIRSAIGSYESSTTNSCTDYSGQDWIEVRDDADNLVYAINPHGNALDNVCWGVNIVDNSADNARTDTIDNTPRYFLNRNFYIEPGSSTPISDSVSIRLFITNQELNNLLDAASIDTSNIRILKKSQGPGSPVDLDPTNDATATPDLLTVIKPTFKQYGYDWVLEFNVHSFSEFNTYFSNAIPSDPLPVKWIAVSATKENNNITLKWSTEEDALTDNYQPEWSTDGINFTKIATIDAQHQPVNSNYQYLHTTPAKGINYYRIKQFDKDGNYSLSRIVSAGIGIGTPTPSVSAYPNPAETFITVTNPENLAFTQARIVDAAGRTVSRQRLTPGAIKIDVHQLTKGWYILQLEGARPQHIGFLKN